MNEFLQKINTLPYYSKGIIYLIVITFIFFVLAGLVVFVNIFLASFLLMLGFFSLMAISAWTVIVSIMEND